MALRCYEQRRCGRAQGGGLGLALYVEQGYIQWDLQQGKSACKGEFELVRRGRDVETGGDKQLSAENVAY